MKLAIQHAESVEAALHITSLTILAIFMAQLVCLLIAFGVHRFFRHGFYVVDSVVVIVAIVLETSLHEPASELVVLLISWRALRVLHGLIASAESAHHDFEHVRSRLRGVRRRLFTARSYTATFLRLVSMRIAARTILRWWRAARAGKLTIHDTDAATGLSAHDSSASAAAGGGSGVSLLAGRQSPAGASPDGSTSRRSSSHPRLSRLPAEDMNEEIEDAAAHITGMAPLPRDERAAARRLGFLSRVAHFWQPHPALPAPTTKLAASPPSHEGGTPVLKQVPHLDSTVMPPSTVPDPRDVASTVLKPASHAHPPLRHADTVGGGPATHVILVAPPISAHTRPLARAQSAAGLHEMHFALDFLPLPHAVNEPATAGLTRAPRPRQEGAPRRLQHAPSAPTITVDRRGSDVTVAHPHHAAVPRMGSATELAPTSASSEPAPVHSERPAEPVV